MTKSHTQTNFFLVVFTYSPLNRYILSNLIGIVCVCIGDDERHWSKTKNFYILATFKQSSVYLHIERKCFVHTTQSPFSCVFVCMWMRLAFLIIYFIGQTRDIFFYCHRISVWSKFIKMFLDWNTHTTESWLRILWMDGFFFRCFKI